MRFLATSIIRAADRIGEIAEFYEAEAEAVWRLCGEGRFREVYFVTGEPVAYILLDAADAHAARSALAELPLVRAGILDWHLNALGPLPELALLLERSGTPPPPWWPR